MMSTQIPESWLSAYLDGELSASRRALLDKALKRHPRLVKRLKELTQVRSALRALPRAELSALEVGGLSEDLRRTAGDEAAIQTILAAYVDHELTLTQRKFVEDLLLVHSANRELLERIERLGIGVRSLPFATPPDDFTTELQENLLRMATARPKRPFDELLSAYIDGEARPSLRDRVGQKLRDCPRSKQLATEFLTVGGAVRQLEFVTAPPEILRNVLTRLERQSVDERIGSLRPTVAFKFPSTWGRSFQRLSAVSLALAASVGAFLLVRSFVPDGRMDSLAAVEPEKIEVRSPVVDAADRFIASAVLPKKASPVKFPRAPLIDDPEEDPPPPKTPLALPLAVAADRSFDKLGEGVRSGQIIELDNSEITFLCLDVRQMYDRLQIVLVQTQLSPAAGKTAGKVEPALMTVEVSATPDQLREVLAALRHAEEANRLVASVEVKRSAPPPLVASVQGTVPSLEVPAPQANVISSRPDETRSAAARAKTLFPESKAMAKKAAAPPPMPAPERLQVRFVLRESKARSAIRIQ